MKYRHLLAAGLLAAGAVVNLRADITSSLIAHWKFDEASGLEAADSSGRGNTAGLQNFPGDNSQWVSGRVGGALRFNVNDPSHDDFVFTQGLSGLAFDNQNEFTFSFWVKLELPEKGSNPRFISPVNTAGWVLWMPGKGVHFEGAPGNTPEPQVGVWRHYSVSLNRTTSRANVWVDGVRVLTDIPVTKAEPGTVDWIIGHSQNINQHGDHWYGKLDDVRIYNRIFTDADAQELFAAAGAEPATPTELVQQPRDASRYVGESVTFSATAAGAGTLTYQWKKGTEDVPGATSATLTLSNLALTDAGEYSVVVTGSNGSATSRAATLTVQKVPPVDITSNLIAHWTFDETKGAEAHDIAGVDDKLILERFTGNPWVPGRVGSGALRMNVNDLTFHDDGLITADPVTLENNTQLTFSFWLKREGDVVPSQPRLVAAPGFWVLWRPNVGVGYEDRLAQAPTPGPVINTWKHFVVTYNSGSYSVYVDGVKAVDGPTPTAYSVPASPSKWYVGHPPSNSQFDTWRGDIDDVRIYNRVLTQVDAQALFAAAGTQQPARPTILTHPRTQTKFIGENVTLTATADGTAPLTYAWYKDGAPLSGANSASLTLRDLTVNNGGQYFVRVTNAQGTVDSEIATLSIEGSPVIDITSDLVAHWKFDETTGLAGADESANNYDVSLANFADESSHWVPGRIGGAVQMNVNVTEFNDLIMTDAPLIFANKQKFTFAFWLRRDGPIPSNESPRLVSPRNTGGWVMYQQSRGVSFEDSQGNGQMPQGVWEHYAVVLDSGIYSVYRNGVKVVDSVGTGLANNLGDVQWVLGHNPDPNSIFDNWRGSMDDVRIYNRALGAGDVRELYLGTGAFNDVYVVSTSPAAGATAVSTGTDIAVTLSNGYNGTATLNPSSVQMQVNGATVTPTLTQSGDQTIVTYNPPGSLVSASANTVKITFSDTANPAKTQTYEYSFTTANVVEVSGGGAALQQAIVAASTDTEIVVIDSLDYSEIQLLKRLYIRAAEGQNPRVVYSGTGVNGNLAVWVTDPGRQSTWDGIDVVQNVAGGGGFLFRIFAHNDDSMFTLKNSRIYIDLPGGNADKHVLGLGEKTRVINCQIDRNDGNGNALVWVYDKGSDSTIENTIIGPHTAGHGILNTSPPQSGPLTVRNVTFVAPLNRAISHHDNPGFYNIDNTKFGNLAGTDRMFSIFTGDNRANGSVYNISRSTFVPARSGEGVIFAADGSGVTFTFTNSVFKADDAQARVIRSFRQSHAWKFVHCTITESAARAGRSFIDLGTSEAERAGTETSSFNFQNNIINWPASTDALVIAARTTAATVRGNVTAGKNLFNMASSHADDALRTVGGSAPCSRWHSSAAGIARDRCGYRWLGCH